MLTVIQTPTFQRTAKTFWSEEDVFEFVAFIAEHPDAGDVIPGTGALRKVRWSRAGMGKRGGARVVYFVRNAAGEVRELQVRLHTRFRVRDQKGGNYVPDSTLMQYREISYVETYALSKANEEEMLYRNMQTDIVQQIVRRLAIVKSVTPTD